MTTLPLDQLRAAWDAGIRAKEMADRFGISPAYVFVLARRNRWPKRQLVRRHKCKPKEPDPTPGEIAERAAYCRAMRERGTPIGG